MCLIFIVQNYLEELQQKWLEVFSSKMRSCLNIIQALSRAAQDSTTTTRFHHSKALDVSNILRPVQQFPYPVIFMTMTGTLAKLLADHPALPLQGAQGISAELNHVLATNQIGYDSSSRSSRSRPTTKGKDKGAGKGKPKGKETQQQNTWRNYRNKTTTTQSNPNTTLTEHQIKPSMADNGMTAVTLQDHQDCHHPSQQDHTEPEHIHKQLPRRHTKMSTTQDTNLPQHQLPLLIHSCANNVAAPKDQSHFAQIVTHILCQLDFPIRYHKSLPHHGALELTHMLIPVTLSLDMENAAFVSTTSLASSLRRTSISLFFPIHLIGAANSNTSNNLKN